MSTNNEVASALRQCLRALASLAVASALVNVLYLTGSIYMLEIYDRVLSSRSVPTLVALSALALSLYAIQAVLELLRSRVAGRVGRHIGEALSRRVYDLVGRLALSGHRGADGLQAIRDLDQIRQYFA